MVVVAAEGGRKKCDSSSSYYIYCHVHSLINILLQFKSSEILLIIVHLLHSCIIKIVILVFVLEALVFGTLWVKITPLRTRFWIIGGRC